MLQRKKINKFVKKNTKIGYEEKVLALMLQKVTNEMKKLAKAK